MMNLERHIEILLLDNDCVIVPEFGGFVAHRLSARYEEAEGLFLPPLRTLGFNPQLRLNDSLLAQSYADTYDISLPEALRRIAAEVEELKGTIARNGEYEFNNLGKIRLNAEGRYEFTPCEAGILTPDLYGLDSFEMPTLPSGAQIRQLNVADRDSHTDERTITIKLSTLRNVAAACIAALVIWLFPSQQSADSKYSVANSNFNTELLKRIMPREVTTGAPKQLAQQPSETSTAKENVQAPKVPAAPAYVIVLACQVSQKNADNFILELQKKGFSEGRTIMMKGKDLRVVYGQYASENEAYNALRPLRRKSADFAEGWIMKLPNP